MSCVRIHECSMALQLEGRSHLLKVLRHLYCDLHAHRCARLKVASIDRDVPPDMLPNGASLSEVAEARA